MIELNEFIIEQLKDGKFQKKYMNESLAYQIFNGEKAPRIDTLVKLTELIIFVLFGIITYLKGVCNEKNIIFCFNNIIFYFFCA